MHIYTLVPVLINVYILIAIFCVVHSFLYESEMSIHIYIYIYIYVVHVHVLYMHACVYIQL